VLCACPTAILLDWLRVVLIQSHSVRLPDRPVDFFRFVLFMLQIAQFIACYTLTLPLFTPCVCGIATNGIKTETVSFKLI